MKALFYCLTIVQYSILFCAGATMGEIGINSSSIIIGLCSTIIAIILAHIQYNIIKTYFDE